MAFAYEVYCYYNVDTLKAVFNGVAMIVNGGGYASLVKTVMTLGVILAAMFSLSSGKFEGMKWFIVSAIFYIGFLGPKTNVMLVDRLAVQPPVVIANVPIGLAFMAHFTSSVGDWMTTNMETAFTSMTPSLLFKSDGANDGKTHGLMFGAKLLSETRRAVIADPNLRMDWYAFIRNCTIYDIAAGRIDPAALQKSLNILADLGATSAARLSTITTVAGQTMFSCQAAHASLSARTVVETNIVTAAFGRMLNPNIASASPNAAVLATFNTQTADITGVMLGTSRNATDMIQQSMMINLMDSSGAVVGQQLGDPGAVAIALAQASAEASANSSYASMAKVAESAMPKIRNVIEVVVYAVFPIVMLIILVAGHRAGAPLKSYFMTMIWLQLWPPLYAILNMVVTMETTKELLAITVAQGGGLTLASAADMGATALSSQAIAGYMVMLIPAIAGAIVKGGEQAAASVAAQVMAPAQQAGQQAGGQAGTGNLSLGNTSLDTHSAHSMSANKSNTNSEFMSGSTAYQGQNGGVTTSYGGGAESTYKAPSNDVGFSGTLGDSAVKQASAMKSKAVQIQETTSAAATMAVGADFASLASAQKATTKGATHTKNSSTEMSADQTDAAKTTQSLAMQIAHETQTSDSANMAIGGVLAAGGSWGQAITAANKATGGKGTIFGMAFSEAMKSINSKGQLTGELAARHSNADKITKSDSNQRAIERSTAYGKRSSEDTTGAFSLGATSTNANGVTATHRESQAAQRADQTALSQVQAAQESLQKVEAHSANLSADVFKNRNLMAGLADRHKQKDLNGHEVKFDASWLDSNEKFGDTGKTKSQIVLDAFRSEAGIPSDVQDKVDNMETGEQLLAKGRTQVDSVYSSAQGKVAEKDKQDQKEIKGEQQRTGAPTEKQVNNLVQNDQKVAASNIGGATKKVEEEKKDLKETGSNFSNPVSKEAENADLVGRLGSNVAEHPVMAAVIGAGAVLPVVGNIVGGAIDAAEAARAEAALANAGTVAGTVNTTSRFISNPSSLTGAPMPNPNFKAPENLLSKAAPLLKGAAIVGGALAAGEEIYRMTQNGVSAGGVGMFVLDVAATVNPVAAAATTGMAIGEGLNALGAGKYAERAFEAADKVVDFTGTQGKDGMLK